MKMIKKIGKLMVLLSLMLTSCEHYGNHDLKVLVYHIINDSSVNVELIFKDNEEDIDKMLNLKLEQGDTILFAKSGLWLGGKGNLDRIIKKHGLEDVEWFAYKTCELTFNNKYRLIYNAVNEGEYYDGIEYNIVAGRNYEIVEIRDDHVSDRYFTISSDHYQLAIDNGEELSNN